MKNKMTDVRNLLIEGMEKLLDDDNTSFDYKKAKALAEIGSVLIDSAKAEVDYINALSNGGDRSQFIDLQRIAPHQEVITLGEGKIR